MAHNRYRSALPSGENQVVESEIAALRDAGVEVVPYIRSSDEIEDLAPAGKLRVPLLPVHSPGAAADVERLLEAERPDLVHLHNPYPFISLSVVRVAHRHGVPIVQTVHNHRHSCMKGTYFRDGRPCTDCRGRSLPWPAVVHGCYRDSRLQSVPMAIAFATHRSDQRAVDRYIALTPQIAQSLLGSGLVPPDRVTVRPNSVPDPGTLSPIGSGLLFVGRLTDEKGVPLLLDAWERAGRPFVTLRFVGDGPLRERIATLAADRGTGIELIGPTDPHGVATALRASAALVVPSTAPEALPLVVLEALAHGRPVLATEVGGLPGVVGPDVGWLAAPSVAALADRLRTAARDDLADKGAAARTRYETTFAPRVVMTRQLEIYREVLAEHGTVGA